MNIREVMLGDNQAHVFSDNGISQQPVIYINITYSFEVNESENKETAVLFSVH